MLTFEQELEQRGGFKTRTTLRILPPRQAVAGPRDGMHLDTVARGCGDRAYFAFKEIYRYVCSKIEERFDDLPKEIKYQKRFNALMGEAKSILNEQRNDVVEAVLPMFTVRLRPLSNRYDDGQELLQHDQDAYDFIILNVLTILIQRYIDWLPEFVNAPDVETAEIMIRRIGETQKIKLARELRNYEFQAKIVVAPKRA
jgi:hypothetical protein